MPELGTLVDIETLLVAHLVADEDLAALVDDRVSSPDLPKGFRAEARVRLYRVGGSPDVVNFRQDPSVHFNAYGATPDEALQVSAALVVAILRAPSTHHDLGNVTKARVTLGPIWSPDPPTNAPGYFLQAILTVSPHRG